MKAEAGAVLTTPCYLNLKWHDKRGRLCAHHSFLPKMYHDNRGRLSAQRTLYLTYTMITEVGSLLPTPCYVTYTMITSAGTQLATP